MKKELSNTMMMPGDANSRRRRRVAGVESSSTSIIGEGRENTNEGKGSSSYTEVPSPSNFSSAHPQSFAASGGGGGGGGSSVTLPPQRSYYNFDPMAMAYESGVGSGSVVGEARSSDKQQQRRPSSPLEMTMHSRRWQQHSLGETKSFSSSPTTKSTTRMETTTMFTTEKKLENDENDPFRDNHHTTLSLTIHEDDNDENNNENHIFRNNSSSSSRYSNQPQPPKLSDFLINDICYQKYLLEGRRPARYRGLGSASARRNNRKRGNEGDGSSIMDPTFIANACAVYCFIAMIFLIFVAIIIETQPLFLKGVSVKSSSSSLSNMYSSSSSSSISNRFGSDIEYDPTYDNYYYSFRKETSNALKASAAYFVIMVLCYVYLQAKDMNYLEYPLPFLANVSGRICHTKRVLFGSIYRYRRRHYDDIPDHDSYDDLPPSSFVVRRGEEGGRRTSTTVLPTHHHNSSNGYGESGILKSRGVRKKVVGNNSNNNHVSGQSSSSSSSSSQWSMTSLGIGMGVVSPILLPPPPTTTVISSSVVGDAIENVWIKVKSWGSGIEGSSRNGRKKDR